MATRPVFLPVSDRFHLVDEKKIEFRWHPGLSKQQAQKSICSLHEEAARHDIHPILEISSKSPESLGVSLSAFNLIMREHGKFLSVECAYQGSKIFENGGPYSDIYDSSSRDAKRDERLRTSGRFVGYQFFCDPFPDKPVTAFYDWLYIKALSQNPRLSDQLFKFRGFTDIVFNPQKSINCQARGAALFVSLSKLGELDKALNDVEHYLYLIKGVAEKYESGNEQAELRIYDGNLEEKKDDTLSHSDTNKDLGNLDLSIKKAGESEVNGVLRDNKENLTRFDTYENYFLANLPQVISDAKSKKEISSIFGLPERLVSKWLSQAQDSGKVKKLTKPERYVVSSKLPHEQLSVKL